MLKRYVVGEPTEWMKKNFDKGYVLHMAARPLYGHEVDNSWEQPFIHGRHCAFIDPTRDDADFMKKRNLELDAREVIFVSEQDAFEEVMLWYEIQRPDEYEAILKLLSDDGKKKQIRDWLFSKIQGIKDGTLA